MKKRVLFQKMPFFEKRTSSKIFFKFLTRRAPASPPPDFAALSPCPPHFCWNTGTNPVFSRLFMDLPCLSRNYIWNKPGTALFFSNTFKALRCSTRNLASLFRHTLHARFGRGSVRFG